MKFSKNLMTTFAAAASLMIGTSTFAATTTYTLVIDPGTSTYELFAQTDNVNGLSSVVVDLVNITNATNVTPRSTFSGVPFKGFTVGNLNLSGNGQVFSGQNTTSFGSLVYGIGNAPVSSSAFDVPPFTMVGDATQIPTRIAFGDYDGVHLPGFGSTVSAASFDFLNDVNTSFDSIITSIELVPEPAALGLLSVGMLAVLGRRRHAESAA